MAKYPRYDAEEANGIIQAHASAPGALLPMLHALQAHFGAVPKAALKPIAEALNLSQADVYGVMTFYHDFKETAFEGRTLQLCRAEACQAAGCEDLVEHLAHRHHLKPDAHSGEIRVETVYCLGNCALSPAALFEGEPVGRLDAQKLDDLLEGARA